MPRKYIRKSMRGSLYTQEALDTAISKINGKELSYAAASQIYGIPKSTLSDKILKKTARTSSTLGRSTAIPIELETKLAICLRTMEKWGWGLTREEVLDITEAFVKNNKLATPFKNNRPGPDWFISFCQRHNICIKKLQPAECFRKNMTDPFVINEYFTLLENTMQELNISDAKRIWNLGKTYVSLNPTNTKGVDSKGESSTRITCGSTKELNITILVAVNADGQKLDPLILYKGKNMYHQCIMKNSDKYDFQLAYIAIKKEWTGSDIFYNYMLNIVIPKLGEERPVLLLYDGHVSHVNDEVVALAVENNITILKFPAYTSHLIEPLDVALFKSLKTKWDKNLVKWQRHSVAIKLQKKYFANMFAKAWQATTPEVIRNGFSRSGIHPLNAAVVPIEEFDPKAYARWQKHISQATPE